MEEYNDVAIVGVGQTEFGEHEEKTLVDLYNDAFRDALADAGVEEEDIEAIHYGNLGAAVTEGVSNLPAHIVDELGLDPMEAVRYEGACASSSVALVQAYKDVKAGYNDIVAVGGSEKLKSAGTEKGTEALATASREDRTFPEVFAQAAEHYSERYDIPMEELEEQMAHVSMKNHEYGAENPKAQFYGVMEDLDVEDVRDADTVADPLTLLDCCPMTDGGSAVILARGEVAEELTEDPVYITGTGLAAGGTMTEYGEDAIEALPRQAAAREAFEEAGIKAEDIDFAEVHDCFTIAEPIATEAIGFFDYGKGVEAAADGKTRIEGEIPVNPSGGLIGKGHPVGATGTGQVYSAFKTLRGEYDYLEDSDTAIVDTLGGDFGTVAEIILESDRDR